MRFFPIGATVALILLSAAPAMAGNYTLTIIGAATGTNSGSVALSVNNVGQVVGTDIELFSTRGFLWQAGTLTATATLPPNSNSSFAQAINASGQVAGYSRISTGVDHAFLQTGGSALDLGDFAGGTNMSKAYGINAGGWVVGESSATTGTRGFIWNGTTLLNMGDLVGGANLSVALAINDSNVAVGHSVATSTNLRAVKWEAGTLTDLGELPGGNDMSQARAINNAGVIAGYSAMLGPANISVNRAVRWDGTTITELGELPGGSDFSIANGINESGDIVGRSMDATGDRAVLWQNNVLYDLNDLVADRGSFVLREAYDINDLGWIVGYGFDPVADRNRAFVLIPEAATTATPEPASALLVLASLAGLAIRRRPA